MNLLPRIVIVVLLGGGSLLAATVAQQRRSTAPPTGVVTALLKILVAPAEPPDPAKLSAERAQLEKSLKTTPTDLDGDGAPEYLVKVEMPSACDPSGNCKQFVFQRVQDEFELILQATGRRLSVLSSASQAYRDLVVEGHLSESETFLHEYVWQGSGYERSKCKVKESFAHGSSITTEVSCDPAAETEMAEPVDLDSLASNIKNSRRTRSAPLPESEPEPAPESTSTPTPKPTPTPTPTPTPSPVPVLPPGPAARFWLLNGVFPVSARGFRAFPFRLMPNGLSVLRGQISVQGPAGLDINFCVTDIRGYENYANNRVFNAYFCSGRVKLRQFELPLPPGDYFFILDNRHSLLANKSVVGLVEVLQ